MPSITTVLLVADVNHPESVAQPTLPAAQSCEARRSFIMPLAPYGPKDPVVVWNATSFGNETAQVSYLCSESHTVDPMLVQSYFATARIGYIATSASISDEICSPSSPGFSSVTSTSLVEPTGRNMSAGELTICVA